jgi:hypothetical protein
MKKKGKDRIIGDQSMIDTPTDGRLMEDLTDLAVIGDRRNLSKADTEVKEAVDKATRTDLRNIMIIEKGRCPMCHSRTENFLFTVVCPSCGWFKRDIPVKGRSYVHLKDGDKILCDYVHRGGSDEFLCIRNGVVVSEVMRASVVKIDHIWEEEELEEVREVVRRTKEGICGWCDHSLSEAREPGDDQGPFEDYVAFGAYQEHHIFCSEKHQRAFRRQYPSRVHRNCYETDCNTCNLCIKRFDTHGFKRSILK